MAKENPITQVLPTYGNQSILAAGNPVSSLNNGQLGIFNFRTGLSVYGTVLTDAQDIFIALGVYLPNLASTTAATELRRSAGQLIKPNKVNALTVKGYMPEVEQVTEITNFVSCPNQTYTIKLLIQNQRTYRLAGWNQFSKVFSFATPCNPSGSCDCSEGTGDAVVLAAGLIANINADPDNLVVASAFSNQILATINAAATGTGNITVTVGTTIYTVPVVNADSVTTVAGKIVAVINTQTGSPYKATNIAGAITIYPLIVSQGDTDTFAVSGEGVTATGIQAATKTVISNTTTFDAAYPGAAVGIRITGVAETRPTFNDVNPLYAKTGTSFGTYLVSGFNCNGIVTPITNLQYVEGSGYDVKYLEYTASGFNGRPGPYRISPSTGLSSSKFTYLTNLNTNYTVIEINHSNPSVSGFENYDDSLRTIIAVPCGDTTTLEALFTIFDRLFIQFAANSTQIATITCSNTQSEANINELVTY